MHQFHNIALLVLMLSFNLLLLFVLVILNFLLKLFVKHVNDIEGGFLADDLYT